MSSEELIRVAEKERSSGVVENDDLIPINDKLETSVQYVDTIADLRALEGLVDGQSVSVAGAVFVYDESEGDWVFPDRIPVEAWGASVGISSDQSSAMQEAADEAKTYGAQLVVGGNSATTSNPSQSFRQVTRDGGSSSVPTCKFIGTKDQFFSMQLCDYLQFYVDTDVVTDTSIAYSTFELGKIDKLELATNPSPLGSTIQWINENVFRLQRCKDFIVGGTYQHNHNRIYGGTFESTASITLNTGWDNKFYDMRFENGATVTFASGTERNTVINTWDSSRANFDSSATVVDDGSDNVVVDDFFLYRHGVSAAYTDVSGVALDTMIGGLSGRDTYLQKLVGTATTSEICSSGMIPVDAGDVFRWVGFAFDGTTNNSNARYRQVIEFYDRKLAPVAASASFIYSPGGVLSTVSGNAISAGTNVAGAVGVIEPDAISDGVAFVRVIWRSNSPVTASISEAVSLQVIKWTPHSSYKGYAGGQVSPPTDAVVSGIPTEGFAPQGYSAIKEDGSERYINMFALDVVTDSANVATDTVITFASGTGLGATQNGDVVGVNLDDGSTHWSTISSGGGTLSITLTDALPADAAAGSRAVFNRWTTETV